MFQKRGWAGQPGAAVRRTRARRGPLSLETPVDALLSVSCTPRSLPTQRTRHVDTHPDPSRVLSASSFLDARVPSGALARPTLDLRRRRRQSDPATNLRLLLLLLLLQRPAPFLTPMAIRQVLARDVRGPSTPPSSEPIAPASQGPEGEKRLLGLLAVGGVGEHRATRRSARCRRKDRGGSGHELEGLNPMPSRGRAWLSRRALARS
jgi:hypothetical protein